MERLARDLQMTKKKAGRPPAIKSPDELEKAINEYQTQCDEKEDPFTLIGLSCFMGINRCTLREYKENPIFSATYKKAETIAEEHLVRSALTGKYNAAVSIFLLKNNHKYVDKQEIESDNNHTITVMRKTITKL